MTEQNITSFMKHMKEGKVWRTSTTLSQLLEVEVSVLDSWIRSQSGVVIKESANEGVFLYALKERLANEQDHYAICTASNAMNLVDSLLKKYASKIHSQSSEAFDKLLQAKANLEAVVYLLAVNTKSEIPKGD